MHRAGGNRARCVTKKLEVSMSRETIADFLRSPELLWALAGVAFFLWGIRGIYWVICRLMGWL